uniref:Uncharacterized protein n=1 Tax=Solanum tuberosum TaxID=4113 RepID=M1AR02_SOLTU
MSMYISSFHVFLTSKHLYFVSVLYFHFLNLYIDIFSILYRVYRCIQQVHSPLFGLSDLETSNSSLVYTSGNLYFSLLLADSMNKVLGLYSPIGKCEEKRYESETTRVVSHATQWRELVVNNNVSKSKY